MSKRDLFVVVADLDAENAIRTLLCDRQLALGIRCEFNPDRPPAGDLLRYSKHDSGCYRDAENLLRPMATHYRHALLIFDWHGCGKENQSRKEIEQEVERRLAQNGWPSGNARVVVIEPELEAWVWADSTEVAKALGWNGDMRRLREFLEDVGAWNLTEPKPSDPKKALGLALRRKRQPRGARVFSELARTTSVRHCSDPAFSKLKMSLVEWFPA